MVFIRYNVIIVGHTTRTEERNGTPESRTCRDTETRVGGTRSESFCNTNFIIVRSRVNIGSAIFGTTTAHAIVVWLVIKLINPPWARNRRYQPRQWETENNFAKYYAWSVLLCVHIYGRDTWTFAKPYAYKKRSEAMETWIWTETRSN